MAQQSNCWKLALAGLPPLELPTDRPRPAVPSYRGAHHALTLSAELSAALKQVSRREGVTLYMLLLAAFQVLLARRSGQDDIAVGIPIAGHTRHELEGMIGIFTNTLLLRTDLSGNPRFNDLLAQVRENALDAYAHQEVPFEKLMEELKPERDVSRNPLFQVMFVLQNAPGGGLTLPGLEVATQALDTATAKFDLLLALNEGPEGLRGVIQYATDLFDAATISRLAGHFTKLLEGIVAHPETPVDELPLLSPAERHQLLVEWNDTLVDYPRDRCIHQLFEEQAARTPGAVAAVFEDRQLTYAELNTSANQLAHHLCTLGVGPEVLVGICLERSLELVIGLLGILKAGGAYVPLDPSYPKERLAFMLRDTGAPVLLTQQRLLGQLPQHAGAIVCLDRDWPTIAARALSNPRTTDSVTNLAYVIYTSGSTGSPKGVMIEHRALVNHIEWVCRTFNFDHHDSMLQRFPISFDPAAMEIFTPLLAGGRLVLVPPDAHRDPVQILRTLREHDVTTVVLVPSLFRFLVQEPGLADCVHLTRVFCGGEVLPGEAVHSFLERSSAQLYNLYGPTETCIVSVWWTCRPTVERATPPIGRPIANTAVYVLDPYRQPVPMGVAGELYIGGDGLARGYWNQPELTAERFVPDPFSAVPGARLYRTGDRVRYLPDGNLEFLGRLDTQVKLRGFRIELGEIESRIALHPAVREAAVIAREDVPGDKHLVAYVVPNTGQRAALETLRIELNRQLPEYMMPSALVVLEKMPLTPNGKVDHKALPAPNWELASKEAYLEPRTPTERELAEIFASLLGVKRVGMHDNFFELGGHSIKATQLLSRVRKRFDVEVPIDRLFDIPTVAQVAAAIEELQRHRETGATEIGIERRPKNASAPLSFAQGRVWFIQHMDPSVFAYNYSGAIHFNGELDVKALEQSLTEIVRRHEIYRTTFPEVDGAPVQRIHAPWQVTLRLIDLSELPDTERWTRAEQLIRTEGRKHFDMAQLPLVKWFLIRLTDSHHVLAHVDHHFVHDGWSLNVLLGEMVQIYRAYREGRSSPLEELPIQFSDFAAWQREWMQGAVLQSSLDYWEKQLSNSPAVLELPGDRPRPLKPTYDGGMVRRTVSQELAQGLRDVSGSANVTLFMTMQAAFAALLGRYSSQDDICVGASIANRRWPKTETLIGMILNNIVIRHDLSGNPSFRELQRRTYGVVRHALRHQDVPFEKVVGHVHPVRSSSYHPLFQVMLSFHDAPKPNLDLPGLAVRHEEAVHNGSAKFDLNVIVIPYREQRVGNDAAEASDEIDLVWEYNADIFDRSTAERMADHFMRLLEGVAADPECRLSEITLLAAAEREQMLVTWNDTAVDYPRDHCIHQLFEEQVTRTPEAVAVLFEDRRLTYAELNARANQLAHHLISLGVGPEVLVGICLERSLELIIGLLGILKAGGAYVPLDPDNPPERLRFMLDDTSALVVLTQSRLMDKASAGTAKVLFLDAEVNSWQDYPDTNLLPLATAEDPAYVMYTSGSTGAPKGVIVLHRNIARLVCNTDYVQLDPTDCVAQLSNPAFDAATFEVWGALANGSRLTVIPREVALDPARLADELRDCGVSTLFLTTALFNEVVRARPNAFAGLKQVLFGGEAVAPNCVREYLGAGRPQRLLHVYGPTETTTFATWYLVNTVARDARTIPIGGPITNTTTYVLDTSLKPVPVGVPGELYIGGDGLARGYWKRPELTAERFVPDPFSAHPGARLYRTGDRVRYLPDGNLEFLGRLDTQVKLRGFRIELGEIEAVLVRQRQVREAVVQLREDTPGDPRLVAYVVPQGEALVAADLRAALKQQLPDYMVPAAFVQLPALPLTPNGKIDRKALPAPEGSEQVKTAYVAPRTATEETLARIWSEVLGLKRVGIADNFFELGGHSLLAARVVSQVRQALSMELPLRELFVAPTIAELSVRIEALRTEGGLVLPRERVEL